MYKVLADTSTDDLFIALMNGDNCIDYILIKNLLKKTDALPVYFKKLLDKNKIEVKNIEEFYATNGPGSFTGSRSAFLFFKTICMLNNSQLYLSSSLKFLAKAKGEQFVIIDAKSKMQYIAKYIDKKLNSLIELKISDLKTTKFILNDFLENTKTYLDHFDKVENILDTKVNYIKLPSIGKVKK